MDDYRVVLARELAKEYSIKKFNFEAATSPKEFLEFYNNVYSELFAILSVGAKNVQDATADICLSAIKNSKDCI